jgi:hypothetical protein
MDESDFRFSDEKAEIVKILNNGNVKGFPVLRCEVNRYKEFNPRAFNVFGPKVLATRGHYDDKALESRFLTEDMGQGPLRKDIPIGLPNSWEEEARSIRNKLLLYRFRHYGKAAIRSTAMDPSLEPRMNQIYRPILAVMDDTEARQMLLNYAHTKHREVVLDRTMEMEAQVLSMILDCSRSRGRQSLGISIKHIADRLSQKHGLDYDRAITPKWIGTIVRQKLHLKTYKRHGAFVVSVNEKTLEPLYEKYGIRDDDDAAFLSRGAPDDSLALPIGGLGDLGTLGEEDEASDEEKKANKGER